MRRALATPFAGVVEAELLFNAKRAAPYVLMLLFSVNAIVWWGWGPAVARGWAVNSEFYIVRLFGGFTFMTLPFFIALMMGDAVIRDFDAQIDPLLFSKPVRRLEYLGGKFVGNFLVLVGCQAAFAVTLVALQWVSRPAMIVLAPRVLPYLEHFLFFVVVSSLPLAALFFTIGSLTRNVKVVYGVAAAFYFLYVAWQYVLKAFPAGWRIALDPLLFNVTTASRLNISYDASLIANRVIVTLASLACLAFLHLRFTTSQKVARREDAFLALHLDGVEALPARAKGPFRTAADPFLAALGTELRLLREERSAGPFGALAVLACIASVVMFDAPAAAYASRTAQSLQLFLLAIAAFHTSEALSRDRVLRVEPLLWCTPVSNAALVLAKLLATFAFAITVMTAVGGSAIASQLFRGQQPSVGAYVATYAILLVPTVIWMIAVSAALHSVLRDKHLAAAATLAVGGGIYFLATIARLHPLLNFPLFGIEVTGAAGWIGWHRAYTCAAAGGLIWTSIRLWPRK